MMDEEKTRKALDNLVRDIAVSTKRSEVLSQLTNKELAEKLISDVWGILKLFGEKSDLLTEAIERLFTLDTPDRVRCTKDGEYPEVNQGVEWNVGVDAKRVGYFVGYLKSNHDISAWGDLLGLHEYDKNTAIYWQPLTSLKEQYERERGGTINT